MSDGQTEGAGDDLVSEEPISTPFTEEDRGRYGPGRKSIYHSCVSHWWRRFYCVCPPFPRKILDFENRPKNP